MDAALALTRTECLERLRSTQVGRVAVTSHALPAIVPVNYAVVGNTLLFRTRPGGMLARACDDTVVAVEVDDVPADARGGWSVLVVGTATLLHGSAALRAIERGLVSAVGEDQSQFVSVTLTRVTGRLVPQAAAADVPDAVVGE